MRILHAPVNITGQPAVLARSLRDAGHKADCLDCQKNSFGYPCDINLNLEPYDGFFENSRWVNYKKISSFFLKACMRYDVFHFHFGRTLLPRFADLPILKALGKKIIFHLRGCDIRDREILRKSEYPYNCCMECDASRCNREQQKKIKDAVARYADEVLVSTPDLIEFLPGSEWLPSAVRIEEMDGLRKKTLDRPAPDKIVIAHAASRRNCKGSRFVIDAIARLVSDGYKIDFRLIENTSHSRAVESYAGADIALDQFLIGSYGTFAIEMMALGKPVISYIRNELFFRYGSPPILNANIGNLYQKIKLAIEDKGLRECLGRESRIYIEKVHDSGIVAKKLENIYKNI